MQVLAGRVCDYCIYHAGSYMEGSGNVIALMETLRQYRNE